MYIYYIRKWPCQGFGYFEHVEWNEKLHEIEIYSVTFQKQKKLIRVFMYTKVIRPVLKKPRPWVHEKSLWREYERSPKEKLQHMYRFIQWSSKLNFTSIRNFGNWKQFSKLPPIKDCMRCLVIYINWSFSHFFFSFVYGGLYRLTPVFTFC
jgi:hypothetical protein